VGKNGVYLVEEKEFVEEGGKRMKLRLNMGG
jgi:hypothetical protein